MRFRQKSFHVCLTEAEAEKLEKKAKETGMKKAQLLRALYRIMKSVQSPRRNTLNW